MNLKPGDYYIQCGKMVLTSQYLLKRGYCCKNGCRHCPYRNKDINGRREFTSIEDDPKKETPSRDNS